MKMKLAEIAKAINVKNDISALQGVEVSSVAFDSRNLDDGALFVPLNGEQDGHKFVASAFENGAAASLWASDHAVGDDSQPLLVVDDPLAALQELASYYLCKINPIVVAVTGSNGKTTTKDMIASILSTQMNVTKTFENFNNEIGVPVTLLNMDPNTEAVVVEMGMDHFGELDALSRLATPDIAVITMIGEAHIEFFGSRDKIADAKMEIVNGLKEDGTLVFNGDEPLLTERTASIVQDKLEFGRQLNNDIYATSVNATAYSLEFVTNAWPDETFQVPMMGEYNVTNALAALSVGKLMHISVKNMHRALSSPDITRNRTEWIKGSAGEQILSDVYNSNPTAVKEVVNVFSKAETAGKRIVVLGDMLELGEQSNDFHRDLSEVFDPEKINEVYLIGPHMKALYDALVEDYGEHVHYFATEEKAKMTVELGALITDKDIVAIKASHGLHLETVLDALTS
ncbi:UDP-N-acetylmuramoyl-tripeptide--D-alanyl-D-alanine ligase [Paucilactobacillus nenjiangensis]|uniref:UDP-N-acetylmuramoyl-tripeptide--D-alanyl-D-alanine ligase n=1 Tax=Paucilactobacillus nenjiangensis TaxID=1296540 RepID=A0A5P1X742_9LACO|nr:UDP-N-acetylmuramoyl-tripeptide--D-alanyl-D-alanine ligase [Paucilactobacillus nenjiangensis]QER68088.1 UDP-N-acetylmuramoyl-tripeptide--D-alanyl-D-alanine ligase [Paucilactobacillus nenjiangensis]